MKKYILSFLILLGISSLLISPISNDPFFVHAKTIENVHMNEKNDSLLVANGKVTAILNAGNFNDYTDYNDYGGDSGGSNWGSSDSSGVSSGDLGWILWIFHILPFPFNIILILVIIVFFMKAGKHSKAGRNRSSGNYTGNVPVATAGVKYVSPPSMQVPDYTTMITNKMKETDPNFDQGKFLSFAEESYLNIQDAWTNNDWEKIRVIEHEDLYKKHERQLNEYKNNGTRNVLERISVNQTYLYKYVIDNQYEHLSVLIDATMNDYIININTQQIVRGDYNTRWRGKYIVTFTRSIGTLTDEVKDTFDTTSCPNCGAPIEVTSAGKCRYCDFIITSSKHAWVVSDIDCIKPDYKIDTRGVIDLSSKNDGN